MNGTLGMGSFVVGSLSSIGMVIAQLPIMPTDMNTWPATAILGFIAFACLCITFFCVKKVFSTIEQNGILQGKLIEKHAETNTRLNELCEKIGKSKE